MKIAIASGKGGTGKTTVAASLVSLWGDTVTAVDLDVEEPNLHLFLKPEITRRESSRMEIPIVDESVCTYCRMCAELCQFKAISVLGSVVITFPEMCHGCGGCMAICPEGAITPGYRELGEISMGLAGRSHFFMGRLRVGEAMSPPLIREVKTAAADWIKAEGDTIFDAPPGVSCPAVNAVTDVDLILLVTEPTPFGLYDLKLAVEAFTPLEAQMGVVVNRAGIGDRNVHQFCQDQGIPIIAEIPFDRKVAEAYATGHIPAAVLPDQKRLFSNLVDRIRSNDGFELPAKRWSYA